MNYKSSLALSLLFLWMTGCAQSKHRLHSQQAQCATMQEESTRFRQIEAENQALISGQSVCFSISKQEIDHTMRANAGDIHHCFQESLAHCPERKKIELSVAIDELGTVSSASVIRGTHYSPDLLRCVEEKVMKWEFPRPRYSDHYAFVYPFVME